MESSQNIDILVVVVFFYYVLRWNRKLTKRLSLASNSWGSLLCDLCGFLLGSWLLGRWGGCLLGSFGCLLGVLGNPVGI